MPPVRSPTMKATAMMSLPMPRNISFRAESVYPKGRVGRIRPNEQGIYCGLPMMVLGQVTQQQTYYDPQSVIDQITGPSRFNTVLKAQKLYGEYGHPQFIGQGYKDNEKLERLMTVDEKSSSHLFTSFYTDPASRDGTVTLRADLKPAGPYSQTMRESLEDPVANTAFSLRAYVDTKVLPDGTKLRNVRALTTFDTVGASGFFSTDKAHGIGLESFAGDHYHDYEINVMQDGNLMIEQIALETYSNTLLNEIFGTPEVAKITQSTTFVETDQDLHARFPTLYRTGLLQDFFKDI